MVGAATAFCQELDGACFVLLFEIENFLRSVLRWELRARNPADWLGLLPEQFVKDAKARATQEREIAYIDPRRASVLSYLNLSELKDVLLETAVWDNVFKYYWPPKEVVHAEFRKLLAVRNKSAHFRPVTRRDLRVALRFAEDLADWTRHYRKARAAAIMLVAAEAGAAAVEFFGNAGHEELSRSWHDAFENGDVERFQVTLATVSNHLAFGVVIPEGSLSPDRFVECLERFEDTLTFCRLGDLGDRFCLYIPRRIPEARVVECFETFLACAKQPTIGLSSEEVRVRFQIAEWEMILPWSIEMPATFTYPADARLQDAVAS